MPHDDEKLRRPRDLRPPTEARRRATCGDRRWPRPWRRTRATSGAGAGRGPRARPPTPTRPSQRLEHDGRHRARWRRPCRLARGRVTGRTWPSTAAAPAASASGRSTKGEPDERREHTLAEITGQDDRAGAAPPETEGVRRARVAGARPASGRSPPRRPTSSAVGNVPRSVRTVTSDHWQRSLYGSDLARYPWHSTLPSASRPGAADAHVRIPLQGLWGASRGRAVVHRRRAHGVPRAAAASLRKVFGNIGITFKGSGFYKTDSRKAASSASKSSKSDSGSTSEPRRATRARRRRLTSRRRSSVVVGQPEQVRLQVRSSAGRKDGVTHG